MVKETDMLTEDDKYAILDFVRDRNIPSGIGTKDEACTVASINLALYGELTDDIPECMSEVIGKWIIVIQDAMPSDMRNGMEWKKLIPLAAGTGRKLEKKRLDVIMTWLREVIVPFIETLPAAEGAAAWAARAAEAAARAAEAEAAEAEAAEGAAAEGAAAWAATAATATATAATAEGAAAVAAAWELFDPISLLAQLIDVH